MPADISFSGASTPLIAVNYAFLACEITPAPTVAFFSGSSGVGHDATPMTGDGAFPAIYSSGATGITISDGTFNGGNGDATSGDGPAPALLSQSDGSVTMSGGFLIGGPGKAGLFSPSPGAILIDPQGGSWSGGQAIGGDAETGSSMTGACGAVIGLLTVDYTVLGGTFTGGAGDPGRAQGFGLAFGITGRTLTINGGTFSGGLAGNLTAGGKVRVYASSGVVPTKPDGSSFTATSGAGYIDYT